MKQATTLFLCHALGLLLAIPSLEVAASSSIDLLEEARARAGRGEDLQATPYYRQVLGRAEAELGESSVALSRLRLEVGALHLRQGRFNEAKALFENAASTFETVLGEQDPQLALALAGLAAVSLKLGQTEQAKGFWTRTRTIVDGLDSAPADSAAVFAQLAPATTAGSRPRDSPRTLRNALEAAEARGDVAAQVATWRRLGTLQQAQGRDERAAEAFERALDLQREKEGDRSSLVPRIDELARVYHRIGAYDSAISWLEMALQIEESQSSPEDPRVAERLARLGLLCREAGREARADTYLTRAVAATDSWTRPEPVHNEAARPAARPTRDDPVLVVEDSGDREARATVPRDEPHRRVAEVDRAGPNGAGLPAPVRFWAQLASRQDEGVARAELETLRRELASILGGLPARVQVVDLEGKGTWYRLQVGAFERREDALALCSRLAQSGHESCWVTSQP